MRPVVACHCQQCRKQSGHFFAATSCSSDDLELITDETLKWYEASDFAKRGFCGVCGSALFWRRDGGTETSILAGTLDDTGGVKLERHIFCADKGDYYEIVDGLDQFPQAD
ncbi:GFA family protein [Pseudahrensia aquimaris]|uniref:GFA family protein n=1 Tax=Pseudahrensia aquimaris TaxID=744461 RepID=A0ABW3FIT6_9HYPH